MHATELPRSFRHAGRVYEENYDGSCMVAEKVDNQVSFG